MFSAVGYWLYVVVAMHQRAETTPSDETPVIRRKRRNLMSNDILEEFQRGQKKKPRLVIQENLEEISQTLG